MNSYELVKVYLKTWVFFLCVCVFFCGGTNLERITDLRHTCFLTIFAYYVTRKNDRYDVNFLKVPLVSLIIVHVFQYHMMICIELSFSRYTIIHSIVAASHFGV